MKKNNNFHPSAKVICDSCSINGDRLITLEVEFHRFVLAEFNTHRQLCLSGDTLLEFDLPVYKKKGHRRPYTMELQEFYNKWSTGVKKHKVGSLKDFDTSNIIPDKTYSAKELAHLCGYSNPSSIRTWCRTGKLSSLNPTKKREEDYLVLGKTFLEFFSQRGKRTFSIKDKLSKMSIRQLNEETKEIQNSTVKNCFFSGEKEVYLLKTKNFQIKSSLDHRFFTETGWKKLKDIKIGEKIYCKSYSKNGELADHSRLKKINGRWRSKWQKEVKPELIKRQGDKCYFCKAGNKVLEVHHLVAAYEQPDLAFDKDNVVATCRECHEQQHKKQGWQEGVSLVSGLDEVVSITFSGVEATYDLEIEGKFPNFVANGLIVHNSRNFQSSRAIPVERLVELALNSPAIPLHWGKNKKGMQADQEQGSLIEWPFCLEEEGQEIMRSEDAWRLAAESAATVASAFHKAGYHKQLVNRLIEPFLPIKGVVTATEDAYKHFFSLRCHEAAQPEIKALAEEMREAINKSEPRQLKVGDWHLPYIEERRDILLEDKIKVSVSCCAQVSYRRLDDSLEKACKIYDMLNLPKDGKFSTEPPHMSPSEHCAMSVKSETTGMSGNFHSKGFYQLRKLLECGRESLYINL